jgi:hypothetical protein
MNTTHKSRIAVLIDADNVSYHYLDVILPEVARYGVATIKRIYGDWTNTNLAGWKPLLQENAITPVQQFSYTTGKNSSDSALIIDAMDLLYSGGVDCFCLVSSDSDFTRLATRLREAGKIVYGFGETKTPNAFIAACDRFVYLDVLKARQSNAGAQDAGDEETAEEAVAEKDNGRGVKREKGKEERGRKEERTEKSRSRWVDRNTRELIYQCIDDVADENGWAYLGDVGNLLNNIRPDFDSRNFGFSKLTDLMRNLKSVELDERPTHLPSVKHIYIRNR